MNLKDMFKHRDNLEHRIAQTKGILSDLDDEGIPNDEATVTIDGHGRIRIELTKVEPLLRSELAAMESELATLRHALATAQDVADGLMKRGRQ